MHFKLRVSSLICVCTVLLAQSQPVTEKNQIRSQYLQRTNLTVFWRNVFKRIETLERHLNYSMDLLATKIDDGNAKIIELMKSEKTVSQIINKKDVNALLIIDVQNDFISGSLALHNCPSKHNGGDVVPIINHLLDTIEFDVVAYSFDWHPEDHISFFDNLPLRSHFLSNQSTPEKELTIHSTAIFNIPGYPPIKQSLWPRHCVQGTKGAELHPALKYLNGSDNAKTSFIDIHKGLKSDIDSYSAFWDNAKLSETDLNRKLQEKGVTRVFVTGIATDWCVYSTAVHAIEQGYKTFIVEDACRGVDEGDIKEKMEAFVKMNGHLIRSSDVKNYVKQIY